MPTRKNGNILRIEINRTIKPSDRRDPSLRSGFSENTSLGTMEKATTWNTAAALGRRNVLAAAGMVMVAI
ncbi:MAG TPA: hypothetical protein VJW55_13265, partial [Candidatus Angelobacter sp.]|nr:hypothetical protein [Candidatus Angelobacter sp.]